MTGARSVTATTSCDGGGRQVTPSSGHAVIRTRRRQDTPSSGHAAVRTRRRQDTPSSGHAAVRTRRRQDTPPSGHAVVRTRRRQDTPSSGHAVVRTRRRQDTPSSGHAGEMFVQRRQETQGRCSLIADCTNGAVGSTDIASKCSPGGNMTFC